MKTTRDWLTEIPDPEIREKALRNMDEDSANLEAQSISDALLGAFNWSKSPEGHRFWADLAWPEN